MMIIGKKSPENFAIINNYHTFAFDFKIESIYGARSSVG